LQEFSAFAQYIPHCSELPDIDHQTKVFRISVEYYHNHSNKISYNSINEKEIEIISRESEVNCALIMNEA